MDNTDRMMPNDPSMEEAVLGAILLENECLGDVMPVLIEDYFYIDSNRKVFNAIKSMVTRGATVDILTVVNELKKSNQINEAGGHSHITSLTSRVASSSNVEHHIAILKELYLKRSLIRMGVVCIDMGYSMEESADDIMKFAEKKIDDLSDVVVGIDYHSDISSDIAEVFLENTSPRENEITGIPTGNSGLDRMTNGWQKGDLDILCARSSMGKTARSIDFTLNAAANKYKVAFFSLEMPKKKIYSRMLLNASGVNSDVVKYGKWNEKYMNDYEQGATWLSGLGIYVNESSRTPRSIRAVCRQRKKKFGLDFVVIDYLQYIEPDKELGSSERNVSSISKALKGIAKEFDVPVLALAQMNRDVEKRASRRPQLSDLRDSGAIEQDADMVIGLYRPSYYWPSKGDDPDYNKEMISDLEYSMIVETYILKHRDGEVGRMREYFNNKLCKFYPTFVNQKEVIPF